MWGFGTGFLRGNHFVYTLRDVPMQTPKEVLDSYYLEARCQVLEIAAMLDRYERAQDGEPEQVEDERIGKMYESLNMLADRIPTTDRSERLLNLFSDPE